jgi:hypothetical protein
MTEVSEQQLEDMEALFVQSAAGMTSGDGRITLEGLSPSTLYFSDRPKREVGHMPSRQFVDVWGEGENSFATNPPNAVLSFAEPADRLPEDAVVVIQDPHLEGDVLSYSVTLLDGTIPSATGPCALFIDPFGRPLSPVSAAGMHRRERRRMR